MRHVVHNTNTKSRITTQTPDSVDIPKFDLILMIFFGHARLINYPFRIGEIIPSALQRRNHLYRPLP